MEKEQELDFESFMMMKEKRRVSRSKGKRTYEKTKIHNIKTKQRKLKKINYDPFIDEDYYEEYQGK